MDKRRWVDKPKNIPADAIPVAYPNIPFGAYWMTPAGVLYKSSGAKVPLRAHERTGYMRYTMQLISGKHTSVNQHAIMAHNFYPPAVELLAVDHINGSHEAEDNRLDNLEIVTKGENTRRAYALGLNRAAVSVCGWKSKDAMLAGEEPDLTFESIRKAQAHFGKPDDRDINKYLEGKYRRPKAFGYFWKEVAADDEVDDDES